MSTYSTMAAPYRAAVCRRCPAAPSASSIRSATWVTGLCAAFLRYNPSDRLDIMLSADYSHDSHHNGAEVLLYGNNANPNAATVNGLPFDSRFICGKWCNYTTTGSPGGAFIAGAIPPAEWLSRCRVLPAASFPTWKATDSP